MNVCFVSLVTVWQGIEGGMEAHARLGHSVTVVASRHPAGVEAEARGGDVLLAGYLFFTTSRTSSPLSGSTPRAGAPVVTGVVPLG